MRHIGILLAGIGTLACAVLLSTQSQDGKASDGKALVAKGGPVYSLDQFGPVEKQADAEATFQKASKDIIAAGGGVLMIPSNAAAGWKAKNITQEQWRKPEPPEPAKNWGSLPGVTVIDSRSGTVKISPPQATGLEIERTLNLPQGQSLPHWGYYPMVAMKNTILHGSTSYHDWLQEEVKAGKDQKFYVATIRGVFPGEFLNTLYSNTGVQRLYVKSIGYDSDKKRWYFVADCTADVSRGTILSNKNHVNALSIDTFSHNENQTFDFRIWRRNYSQGDNYLMDARFFYMGDVHSTAGDENGVCYAAFIQSDTNIYRGKVEAWNPKTHAMKLKTNGPTLGSGRPIISMNPKKWITAGTATLGDGAKLSADAPVTEDAVGRYFAVDETNEYVPGGAKIRRWYLIHAVKVNKDGTKDLTFIRHWWGAKNNLGAPLLYRSENYGKPLKYVIAPGANAYDVSEGVSDPRRTIKLAPAPFNGTPADFAAGDDVEQAIGPDPFRPIPFRTWIWDHVPGKFPAPVFDVANYGPVGRDSLMWVRGGTGSIDKDRKGRADGKPPFNKLLWFEGACNTGIHFAADTGSAAILFSQPNSEQPIHWQYHDDKTTRTASLAVKRDTGEFTFKGTGIKVDGPVTTTGLSGDKDKSSKNLRGKNIPVKTGETKVAVAFPIAETDENYAVFIEQNWLANRAIVSKDANGFTVEFDRPAPKDAKLDWMLVR